MAKKRTYEELEQRIEELENKAFKLKRSEEALERSERFLTIRNQLNKIFLTSPDEKMYEEVLKVILKTMESECGTFGYFDEQGAFVVPAVTRKMYWNKCDVSEKDIIFQKGTFGGIWGQSIQERKTLIDNDGPFNTPEGHIPIENTIVTPIVFHDEVISTIHLANKPNGYDEEDKEMLETTADQIAPVLYARLQGDKEEKKRKQAAENREKEFGMRTILLDNIPGCIALILKKGTREIVASNRFARELGAVPGQTCFKTCAMRDDNCPFCLAPKLWTTDQMQTLEVEYRGEWYERIWAPLSEDLYVHYIFVITERKLAEAQIKASLKEKEILLREIHHRVKNNMQVIISLLSLQSEKIKEKQYVDMLKESQDRIKSMALIHEKLYQSKDFANIDFGGYVKALVNSLFVSHGANPDKVAQIIETKDLSLGLDYAIPCGLIINELVSNSLKYAFPDERVGEIRIVLQKPSENEVELTVTDNGIGIPEGLDFGTTESLGLDLVKILAEHQLGGKIELNRAGGTSFSIRFPVKTDRARI